MIRLQAVPGRGGAGRTPRPEGLPRQWQRKRPARGSPSGPGPSPAQHSCPSRIEPEPDGSYRGVHLRVLAEVSPGIRPPRVGGEEFDQVSGVGTLARQAPRIPVAPSGLLRTSLGRASVPRCPQILRPVRKERPSVTHGSVLPGQGSAGSGWHQATLACKEGWHQVDFREGLASVHPTEGLSFFKRLGHRLQIRRSSQSPGCITRDFFPR